MKMLTPLLCLAGFTVIVSCCQGPTPVSSKRALPFDKESLPFERETAAKEPAFFLAGTYTSFVATGFCSLWDTLVISKKKNEINVFRVDRSARVRVVLNDKTLKTLYHHDRWYGSYDVTAKTLDIPANEYALLINTQNASLELEGLDYRKIE